MQDRDTLGEVALASALSSAAEISFHAVLIAGCVHKCDLDIADYCTDQDATQGALPPDLALGSVAALHSPLHLGRLAALQTPGASGLGGFLWRLGKRTPARSDGCRGL